MSIKNYQFWFVTGSQHLYGEDTLRQVAEDSRVICDTLNQSGALPCPIVWKPTVKTPAEISQLCDEANFDAGCAGIITWMHTFSPSKMWISGLTRLHRPLLHLHTQFNREIPWDSIDMDFMNLNQSAHGDREHGFIGARLRLPRKIVAGYWNDSEAKEKIAGWMRSAVGAAESKKLKVVRFGDNMRQVAVTEGDKVEAEIKLGWSINTHGIGDFVQYVQAVTNTEVDTILDEYNSLYDMNTRDIPAVREQIKYEAALKKFLQEGGFGAFTTTFEDLHGLEQLPGLAVQRAMAAGYGFGGEGDWKTSALTRIMKVMSEGLDGGTSFMEDYTYHLEKGNELVLGAHMLEVCPTIAATKPKMEVHPLGIGGKNPPARLVFDGAKGKAIVASLIDMGGRMRLIVNDVEAVPPLMDMPRLPVARVMWKPLPNLSTSAEAWILAGGAHHTVMSYSLNADHLRDFANMMGIEFVHISGGTQLVQLEKELFWNDIAWKLK